MLWLASYERTRQNEKRPPSIQGKIYFTVLGFSGV